MIQFDDHIFEMGVESTNQSSVVHAHPTRTPKEKTHLKAHPKYYSATDPPTEVTDVTTVGMFFGA